LAIDENHLKRWNFSDVIQDMSARDTIIYALGVGLGEAPSELRFVYEDGLTALPSMATTLCHPGFWISQPESGISWRRVVHGEQSLIIHKPLAASGKMIGRTSIADIWDRGPGKGAIVQVRRDIFFADGTAQSSQIATLFARDDGGFGGTPPAATIPEPWPSREADAVVEHTVLPQAALIYRLSGDYNPLHADPEIAKIAGFEKPILHGLCTYAIAGWALVKSSCEGDVRRLSQLDVRFSSPVYPGETVRTEIWHDGSSARFRSSVVERGVIVLDRGYAKFLPEGS